MLEAILPIRWNARLLWCRRPACTVDVQAGRLHHSRGTGSGSGVGQRLEPGTETAISHREGIRDRIQRRRPVPKLFAAAVPPADY